MKKLFVLLTLTAVLMSSAACLSSCKSESDKADESTKAQTTVATTTKKQTTTTTAGEPEKPPVTKSEFMTWTDYNPDTKADGFYYEITPEGTDGTVKVTYKKSDSAWLFMAATFKPEMITEELLKIQIKMKGTAGESVMIKPFDNAKYQITHVFTGEVDTVELDLSAFLISDYDVTVTPNSDKIVMFGGADLTNCEGTYTIGEVTYVYMPVD